MLKLAPQGYLAGEGIFQTIGERLEKLGERVFVITDKFAHKKYEDIIRSSIKESMLGVSFEVCLGRCCLPEIERLSEQASDEKADIVVGLGGSSTVDVSKFVGQMISVPVVTAPTVASSSAAFTGHVELYSEDGDYIKREFLESCPRLLILDYKAAGLASQRHLIAGIADAYSTAVDHPRDPSNLPEIMVGKLAESLKNILESNAAGAIKSAEDGVVTEQLKLVVEAIILQNGLLQTLVTDPSPGMLSRILARQLLPFAEAEPLLGEMVAFCSLVQAGYRGVKFVEDIYSFYQTVDLTSGLDELGISANQRDELLKEAAEAVDSHLPGVELDVDELVDRVEQTDRFIKNKAIS